MKRTTQAAQLVAAIRQSRSGMTYGDLLALRVSTCVHKRLAESADRHLKPHEELKRITRRDGLVAFKIVRRYTKWTA